MQGLKCHPSRPLVPEECQINRLHAEAVKNLKDAVEAAAAKKRKRKEKHEKACKIAHAEGKPRRAQLLGRRRGGVRRGFPAGLSRD